MVSGKKSPRSRKFVPPQSWFDVNASSRFAANLLGELEISGAVIGRFAVWAWVPAHKQHLMTKDLDLAVASTDVPKIRTFLESRGMLNRELTIGGVNARHEGAGVNVDFIDRSNREWGDYSLLYAAAIQAAYDEGMYYDFGDVSLPMVPPEYIVLMKIATAERDDERDARNLLLSQTAEIDADDVRAILYRVAPFLRPTFERVLRETGHPQALPPPDSQS